MKPAPLLVGYNEGELHDKEHVIAQNSWRVGSVDKEPRKRNNLQKSTPTDKLSPIKAPASSNNSTMNSSMD